MRKSSLIVLWSLLFISLSYFAFAEELTITTYYPAPYGVYKELESEELESRKMVVGNDSMPTQDGIINFQPRGLPTFRDAGALYYNSAAREFRYYNGSSWQRIATVTGTQCLKREFSATSGTKGCPVGYHIAQSSLSSGSIGLFPRNNVRSGAYLCCPYR